MKKNSISLFFWLAISITTVGQAESKKKMGSKKTTTKTVAMPLIDIPIENADPVKKPDFSSVQESLVKVVESISIGNPELDKNEFFPKAPFDALKDIRFPGKYHIKLVNWYNADILREHKQLNGVKLTFLSFTPGRCKFKKIGTEYNKIAYWSCYGSKFQVSDGTKKKTIKIKALINWGKKWFITHLGPIPKS